MADPLVSIIEEDARRVIAAVNLRDLEGKSILITGASGLIGIHLLACLRELSKHASAPAKVTAVVQSELSGAFREISDFKGARVVMGDLTDLEFTSGLGRFEFVVHAAGYGQPARFMEDPVKTLKLNTSTTLNLFECLAAAGRFLFLSTSEVYSGLPNPPYREDQIGATNTTHPRSCYIEAKRCGEAICNAYRARGIGANSARLSLAYGPGTKPGDRRVLNAFIERGLTQMKIALQDTGNAKRTYCYVSDAAEVLWHILLRGRRPIYNVAGNSRTTIAELARKIGAKLGVPVEFPADSKELGGAPEDVYLDMSLVETDFQKVQYVDLDEGLVRTIEWQKLLYLPALETQR
jgi:nucleoside-diphosphate-sugar epimerase